MTGPAEATPGQAAYEAHAAMVVPRPWRWDQLDGKLRAAWDAAAGAAAAPLRGEITSLREQLRQAESERDKYIVQLDAAKRELADSEATRREYARQLREAKRELEALEGGGAPAASPDVRAREPGESDKAYKAYLDGLFGPVRAEVKRLRAALEGGGPPDDGECPGDSEIAEFARDAERLRDG